MSKQLTIFDEMTDLLYRKIADLEHKIKMEESALKTLDSNDYEDRNEIYSCEQMISSYQKDVEHLRKQILECRNLSFELNSHVAEKHK